MNNFVYLLGRLSRDPELGATRSGTPVLNCAIATNRSVPKGDTFVDEVTFVDFTMWGKRAEAFARYHSKGSRAFISGRLTAETWEDRTTGKPRTKLKVTAEEWEFVNEKGERSRPAVDEVEDTPF